jgi:hypothetical protein
MDLINYIKNNDLAGIPNGMHAVVAANPGMGLRPGVIFTLRNRNSGVNVNQHNRLHPYYLVYIDNQGEVITNHTEVKRLLDLVRSSCKGLDEPVINVCKLFNSETNDGRQMTSYSDLLNQSIGSIIDVKEDKDMDSLFTAGGTTILEGNIKGLDDFELITFLVIKEVSH